MIAADTVTADLISMLAARLEAGILEGLQDMIAETVTHSLRKHQRKATQESRERLKQKAGTTYTEAHRQYYISNKEGIKLNRAARSDQPTRV